MSEYLSITCTQCFRH